MHIFKYLATVQSGALGVIFLTYGNGRVVTIGNSVPRWETRRRTSNGPPRHSGVRSLCYGRKPHLRETRTAAPFDWLSPRCWACHGAWRQYVRWQPEQHGRARQLQHGPGWRWTNTRRFEARWKRHDVHGIRFPCLGQ